jgi:glutamyl-tRNA reductase|tara:strand:- start:6 stop:1301 length:1296 start_codon:yes stop_codon:yes gene_type:complete
VLSVLTINHNNSDISFLESFTFNKDSLPMALKQLKMINGVDECFILSTCNRVEVYVSSKNKNIDSEIIKFISDFHKISITKKAPTTYQFMYGKDAAYHLIKVASGSDSMLLGEPQIINQIKESYKIASSVQSIGKSLHKLIQVSLFAAKRVRSETSLGNRVDSIGSLVIKLGKNLFQDLDDRSALILGTGEISQILISNLKNVGVSEILIASRDIKNAITFADKNNCRPIPLEDINQHLLKADIVFSSTGSSDFIIKKEDIEIALEDRRDSIMFFIDIAVPRDIDPRVGDIDSCYLYNLDDLKSIIDDDVSENNRNLKEASLIIESSLNNYVHWENSDNVKDIITRMRKTVEDIVEKEFKNASTTNVDKSLIAKRISNKILHVPTQNIKNEANLENNLYISVLSEIFDLDKDGDDSNLLKIEDEKTFKNRN